MTHSLEDKDKNSKTSKKTWLNLSSLVETQTQHGQLDKKSIENPLLCAIEKEPFSVRPSKMLLDLLVKCQRNKSWEQSKNSHKILTLEFIFMTKLLMQVLKKMEI